MPFTSPEAAAKTVADQLASDIGGEFAQDVNSHVRGQSLNPEEIIRALETGNKGKPLWRALLDLYNASGGASATPDFSRPCLSRDFAYPLT